MRYHIHTAIEHSEYKRERKRQPTSFSIPFWLLILAAFLLMIMVVLIGRL